MFVWFCTQYNVWPIAYKSTSTVAGHITMRVLLKKNYNYSCVTSMIYILSSFIFITYVCTSTHDSAQWLWASARAATAPRARLGQTILAPSWHAKYRLKHRHVHQLQRIYSHLYPDIATQGMRRNRHFRNGKYGKGAVETNALYMAQGK